MKQWAIIGASGAIGAAFTRQLAVQGEAVRVYAFSRRGTRFEQPNIIQGSIDLTDEASVREAAAMASEEGALDGVILATGILHADDLAPEKSLKDISAESFARVFAMNTIGPALVMKHFLPALQREEKAVFAALSARVGSISDNYLGGWYAYRASKAALNMLIKNASIEMARRYKQAVIVGLHPGTVDSPLSKPFQAHVAPDHLFAAEYSASRMLAVLEKLTPADSGKCVAYDGAEILP